MASGPQAGRGADRQVGRQAVVQLGRAGRHTGGQAG